MEPDVRQRPRGFGPYSIRIQETFSSFYREFHLPTAAIQGHDRLRRQYRRRQRGKD